MSKVYIVLKHDYESGDSNAGEFSASTTVAAVFTDRVKADNYVEEHDQDMTMTPRYDHEVQEHEVQ